MSNSNSVVRLWGRALKHSLKTALGRHHRFAVFYRWGGEWRAWTHKRVISRVVPNVAALEYYRYFVPARGGLVMDVGGELGVETRQFSKLVGPSGRVIVFECMPSHIERLREVADACHNVTAVECACWNSEGMIEFFSGHTPGSNTAVVDAYGQRGQELADRSRGFFG